jgi:hypothetical protein
MAGLEVHVSSTERIRHGLTMPALRVELGADTGIGEFVRVWQVEPIDDPVPPGQSQSGRGNRPNTDYWEVSQRGGRP